MTNQSHLIYQALKRGEKLTTYDAFKKGCVSFHRRLFEARRDYKIAVKKKWIKRNGKRWIEYSLAR